MSTHSELTQQAQHSTEEREPSGWISSEASKWDIQSHNSFSWANPDPEAWDVLLYSLDQVLFLYISISIIFLTNYQRVQCSLVSNITSSEGSSEDFLLMFGPCLIFQAQWDPIFQNMINRDVRHTWPEYPCLMCETMAPPTSYHRAWGCHSEHRCSRPGVKQEETFPKNKQGTHVKSADVYSK